MVSRGPMVVESVGQFGTCAGLIAHWWIFGAELLPVLRLFGVLCALCDGIRRFLLCYRLVCIQQDTGELFQRTVLSVMQTAGKQHTVDNHVHHGKTLFMVAMVAD